MCRPSYNYKPTYQPKPSYLPKPSYKAKPTFQAKPTYESKPVYQSKPLYQPKPSYNSESSYHQKLSYEPKPLYQSKHAYTAKPSYDFKPSYEYNSSYKPKSSYKITLPNQYQEKTEEELPKTAAAGSKSRFKSPYPFHKSVFRPFKPSTVRQQLDERQPDQQEDIVSSFLKLEDHSKLQGVRLDPSKTQAGALLDHSKSPGQKGSDYESLEKLSTLILMFQ